MSSSIPFIDLTQPHIIIDWETLGTTADAAVIALGAARLEFKPNSYPITSTFYSNIEPIGQMRKISKDTVAWWKEQHENRPVLAELMAQNRQPLCSVLLNFCAWLEEINGPYYLWGNGADFDLAILWHIMSQYPGLKLPHWHYRKARCLRQLKSMYPDVKAVGVGEASHHALQDAVDEAKLLEAIITVIIGGEL